MLELTETARLLGRAVEAYAVRRGRSRAAVVDAWQKVASDEHLAGMIKAKTWPLLVPHWDGILGGRFSVEHTLATYAVCATDGSQIEADRHQGLPFALLNVGMVSFSYGDVSTALLQSKPHLFLMVHGGEREHESDVLEAVNMASKRTQLELEAGLDLSIAQQGAPFLMDGSLIFWHLDPVRSTSGREFLERYLAVLQQFYVHKISMAGFISLPKSRELVNVLQAVGVCSAAELEGWVDTDLMKLLLQPWQRSVICENKAHVSAHYPPHLRPHFFYLHVGEEIVRVEVPAWLVQQKGTQLDRLTALIGDQCAKGGGYPIVLAEAHGQAVVRAADREFFYECMRREMAAQGIPYVTSRKSVLKKRLAI